MSLKVNVALQVVDLPSKTYGGQRAWERLYEYRLGSARFAEVLRRRDLALREELTGKTLALEID